MQPCLLANRMAQPSHRYCPAMSRLPCLRHDDLGPDGQKVRDGVVGSRGAELVNEQGALIGPFNAFVHAPDVGRRLGSPGQVLRFGTLIEGSSAGTSEEEHDCPARRP